MNEKPRLGLYPIAPSKGFGRSKVDDMVQRKYLKKPKGAKRVELLAASTLEDINSMLDQSLPLLDIRRKLLPEVSVAVSDLKEYAFWRDARYDIEQEDKEGGIHFLPSTLTLEHVLGVCRGLAAEVLEQAINNPSSDATQIVKSYLLAAIANEKLKFGENDLKTIFDLQRKNGELQVRTQHNQKKLEQQDRKLLQVDKKLQKASWVARKAARDQKHGCKVNATELAKEFTKALGTDEGLVERVELATEGSGDGAME